MRKADVCRLSLWDIAETAARGSSCAAYSSRFTLSLPPPLRRAQVAILDKYETNYAHHRVQAHVAGDKVIEVQTTPPPQRSPRLTLPSLPVVMKRRPPVRTAGDRLQDVQQTRGRARWNGGRRRAVLSAERGVPLCHMAQPPRAVPGEKMGSEPPAAHRQIAATPVATCLAENGVENHGERVSAPHVSAASVVQDGSGLDGGPAGGIARQDRRGSAAEPPWRHPGCHALSTLEATVYEVAARVTPAPKLPAAVGAAAQALRDAGLAGAEALRAAVAPGGSAVQRDGAADAISRAFLASGPGSGPSCGMGVGAAAPPQPAEGKGHQLGGEPSSQALEVMREQVSRLLTELLQHPVRRPEGGEAPAGADEEAARAAAVSASA